MRSFCHALICQALIGLFAAVLLVMAISPALAQPGRQRLILKDGSYQEITKYEVKGDRVRFYSAERGEWEEIPENLIDWTATGKWNHDHRPGGEAETQPGAAANPNDPGLAEAAKIDAEERAELDAEAARIPVVAPGLRLPDETGVWGMDTFQDQPELVHVLQANGDLNRAREHSIIRANIVTSSGAKEVVRIEGANAPVQFHVDSPVFFVSLDAPQPARMMREWIVHHVAEPTIDGIAAEDAPFVGVLYCGLMMTARGPMVLEYNTRFGDPETQAILVRLESELLDALEACVEGRLNETEMRWKPGASACVVAASGGYPGSYTTGQPDQRTRRRGSRAGGRGFSRRHSAGRGELHHQRRPRAGGHSGGGVARSGPASRLRGNGQDSFRRHVLPAGHRASRTPAAIASCPRLPGSF